MSVILNFVSPSTCGITNLRWILQLISGNYNALKNYSHYFMKIALFVFGKFPFSPSDSVTSVKIDLYLNDMKLSMVTLVSYAGVLSLLNK